MSQRGNRIGVLSAIERRAIILGMNPRSGGIPPNENRVRARAVLLIDGAVEDRSLGELIFDLLNKRVNMIRWSV